MLEYILADRFNFIEGIFWLVLGFVCWVFYRKISEASLRKLALVSSVVLVLFGLSDFLQVFYGSFLVPGMEWLYLWKIINVMAIVAMFIWYLYIRLSQPAGLGLNEV